MQDVILPVLPVLGLLAVVVWLWRDRRRQRGIAERAEATAGASVESYRGLFESLVDAVVIEDSDGQIIDANPAATELFGASLWGREAASLAVSDPATGESFGLRDNGTVFPQEVRRNRVNYFGVSADLSLIRDITERRNAERSVRESEERYRIVAEQTGTIVYDYDVLTGHVTWSGAISTITGYSNEHFQNVDADEWARLIHPDDNADALARLDAARRAGASLTSEYRFRHRGGDWIWLEQRGVFLRNDEGTVVRMLGSISDITERKRISNEMLWQASHDALTGLVNRHEFEDRIGKLLKDRRARRHPHALLYLDLDQFKVVNDTCGHRAGDQLLRQITGLVTSRIRDTDTLARLGGDEFGVLLADCLLPDAIEVADGLIRIINEFRFRWDDKVFSIGASIGLVDIVDEVDSVATLFSAADSACYAAKDGGRNRVVVYHAADVDIAERHSQMTLVSRITSALEEERFDLHFQRIQALCEDDFDEHFELLLRMREEGGGVMPDVFIPAAERYNLMPSLDRWAARRAFTELEPMFAADPGRRLLVALNLSGTTLGSERFTEYVQQLFEEFDIPAKAICWEITETAAIANLHKAREFIDAMHALGCRIALDDFGSGLSSFAYLKALPVDYLKIDGAFVRDLLTDPVDQAMVSAIVRVGQAMGIRTIAEFVDSESALEMLRAMGVDYVQGYAIHKPQPWKSTRLVNA
ncbi:MAG: EAL domain-containing protein [Xanthomonadaceae bacterium]|nr:EAL domain-containing protein [Xanthomonadaceae bacterium]